VRGIGYRCVTISNHAWQCAHSTGCESLAKTVWRHLPFYTRPSIAAPKCHHSDNDTSRASGWWRRRLYACKTDWRKPEAARIAPSRVRNFL